MSFILTIYSQQINAQIYDSDQPSSTVVWKQINKDNFQLIFPKEFENSAILLSYQIDSLIKFSSSDLKIKPRKISIIIQSNHIIQNGYAQLAPRKVEAYSTPGPASDNIEWLPNLIQHELRHVAQFDKLTGKIKGPLFEQLALALFGLHLPAWYFEGDAVSIETQFSSGGRGRSPSWVMPIRTNILSGNPYTFNKNVLGSFKDLTPSYYLTGYVMNTYLTNHYGYSVKEKILERMRNHLLRPFNFNRALKKQTGLSTKKLYQASIHELDSLWNSAKIEHTSLLIPTKNERYPTSYFLPQTNQSNEIFALVQSTVSTPQIRKISGQKKEVLINIGYQLTPYFDVNDRYIVWDEIRKDARFGKQTYNIIRLLDLKTNKARTISKKSRFYSPIIASNSQKVYVIQIDENNSSSLVYIDVNSRKSSKILQMPSGILLQQPNLNSNETKIVAIAISEKGTNIIEIDLNSSTWKTLLPWSNQQFERPIYSAEDIIFKAHFNQIDNLYKFSRIDNSIRQLSNSAYGAFYPSLANDSTIYYNEYQHDGYKPAKLSLKSPGFDPISFVKVAPSLIDMQLTSPRTYTLDSISEPVKVKNYNPINDFFNFHSLSLSSNNFESFDNYKPGIFWLANDLLNTSQLKLGYQYDFELEKNIISAELSYQRYYPKFVVSYQNRGQIGYAKKQNSQNDYSKFDFREHYYSLEMQIPLSKYRGKNNYSYGINFGTSYQKRYNLSLSTLQGFNEEIKFPLNYQIYFNRNNQKSQMDLIPTWGQNINIVYRHVPFENTLNGTLFALKTNFYFPGFFMNHGLQLRLSYQKSDGRYNNSYDIPMVSGYAHIESPIVNNTLLMNYRFPIAYPDWSISSLAFIKRFHGYLFADYQNLHKNNIEPTSFGIGISADFNLFRYKLPNFGLGTKLTYINHPSANGKLIPSFSFDYSY